MPILSILVDICISLSFPLRNMPGKVCAAQNLKHLETFKLRSQPSKRSNIPNATVKGLRVWSLVYWSLLLASWVNFLVVLPMRSLGLRTQTRDWKMQSSQASMDPCLAIEGGCETLLVLGHLGKNLYIRKPKPPHITSRHDWFTVAIWAAVKCGIDQFNSIKTQNNKMKCLELRHLILPAT